MIGGSSVTVGVVGSSTGGVVVSSAGGAGGLST